MSEYRNLKNIIVWNSLGEDDSAAYIFLRENTGLKIRQAKTPEEALLFCSDTYSECLIVRGAENHWNYVSLVHGVHRNNVHFPVIFLSSSPDTVQLHSMYRNGLFDCVDEDESTDVLSEALASVDAYLDNLRSFQPESLRLLHTQGFGPLTGNSRAMQILYALLVKVIDKDITVSIFGGSGTGKEIVARFLHHYSRRAANRFVTLNCAAVPEALLESELFGHEKGAFTGAVSERLGKFEYAHEGSLFLDEIGEMSLPLQAKLLRIIEQGQFERIGSNESRQVNVRLITATNRDLEKEVENGRFRRDLLFRIMVFPLFLPPLSERHHDCLLLSHRYIGRFSGGSIHGISRGILKFIKTQAWEGNVRQLENTLTRMAVLENGEILDHDSSGENMYSTFSGTSSRRNGGDEGWENKPPFSLEKISDVEKWLVDRILTKTGGNISDAARRLGISRMALYRKLSPDSREDNMEK